MDTEIRLRRAAAGDTPAIVALALATLADGLLDPRLDAAVGPLPRGDWRRREARRMADDLANEPEGCFVAERAGHIVGFVTTWCDDITGIGYLERLAVAEAERRQGLGRRLTQRALAYLAEAGMHCARVNVVVGNDDAARLYAACGFAEFGRLAHYVRPLTGSAV